MSDRTTPTYTQNRELSWLRFDERVLLEATDPTVPLLEQLKFVSIFTSNLDEFFMIRVGSLHDMSLMDVRSIDAKSGLSPAEQLTAIFAAVRPLIAQRDAIWADLCARLAPHGIHALTLDRLPKQDRAFARRWFEDEVDPLLSPQIVDSHHPFPHLANKVLHVGVRLRGKRGERFGVIPLPAAVPEVLFLPGDDVRWIGTGDLLLDQVSRIFQGYKVVEAALFCVTRNADITPNDEAFEVDEDFRTQMKKLLRSRTRLAPVRLELDRPISATFQGYLCDRLRLTPEQVFPSTSPLKLSWAFSLADRLTPAQRRRLTYPPFTPQRTDALVPGENVLRQVLKHDVLLSYPYESMDPFLQLLREAAEDPAVLSIKITIYRLASRAKLVEHLCAAAENGKDVTVMIELRARFDEQNNIDWSQQLEAAGCRILYGFDAYKVHSKVCLITRKDRSGVTYLTQIGTGNYNEKTATQYTDLSYLTADPEIGADAATFFKELAIGDLEGTYRRLLVAPNAMKDRLLQLIDREIAKGPDGYLYFKLNSVTDLTLIRKLREASCAGVRIDMVVRGICCLLPEVPGETENIHIKSLVGRYLEHARIYCFGRGEDELLYLSSADFMTRNMDRRVEVACPVLSKAAREKIHRIMEVQDRDDVKARQLCADGTYRPVPGGSVPIEAQQVLMDDAVARAPIGEGHRSLLDRLRSHWRR